MIETATFLCSICGESSTDICVYCTKDTCANHRCVRCRRCSDCCECEVPLTATEPQATGIPPGQAYHNDTAARASSPGSKEAAAAAVEPSPPPPPLQPEPEPAATSEDETTPEAIPEPAVAEELVKSLPELFAPDTPPPAPPDHIEPEETG